MTMQHKTTKSSGSIEANKRLNILKLQDGRSIPKLINGECCVLFIESEDKVDFTSIHTATSIAIELSEFPQINQSIPISEQTKILYQKGSHALVFQSQTANGCAIITSIKNDGTCHGKINIKLSKPTIDLNSNGDQSVELIF